MDRFLGFRNIIIILLIFTGCSDNVVGWKDTANITYDMNLPIDKNGYYHLKIDRESVQTLHKVSAYVENELGPIEFHKVRWESNLYWVIGDTLGYIYKRGLTDEFVYVNYDTMYVTWFKGYEVPTTNEFSYSNQFGEINNMIAPTKQMVGDTLRLVAKSDILEQEFSIVLE